MPGREAGEDGEAIYVGGDLFQVYRGVGFYIHHFFSAAAITALEFLKIVL